MFQTDNFFDKVKLNFSKAKDEAGRYSKIAIEKTSGLVSRTKYNFAVNDAENKVVTLMAEIGEYVYGEYLQGAEFPGDIAEKCTSIDTLKEEIAALKDKIADLNDSTVCPSCGEYNSSENIYCAKCGKKIVPASEPEEK